MLAMLGGFKGYKAIFPGTKAPGDASVTDYEDARPAMNHARVGCQLAQTWLLPEPICQAVLWHHNYGAVQDGSAGIPEASSWHIALALAAEAVFVKQKMGTNSNEWRNGGEFALAALDITQEDLDGAAASIKKESASF